jgi:hypothetical protein
VRESVEVTLFAQDGELYVLAKSEGRQAKEIAIRRKKLARLLGSDLMKALQRVLPYSGQNPSSKKGAAAVYGTVYRMRRP